MKILWASPNTLLDTTNGAAMMVRECLRQLAIRGCTIRILSATVFVNPEGRVGLKSVWDQIASEKRRFIEVDDGTLVHRLMVTERSQRRLMLSYEEKTWFDEYVRLLEHDKPNIVLFFDNSLITFLTADEARHRKIPVGVFLMHGNNHGSRWCRDVNYIFTDTHATARMYLRREGYQVLPVGTFINPEFVRVKNRDPRKLLFVNPIPNKGVVLVIQLAAWLATHKPDIEIEIVDSRKTWITILSAINEVLTLPSDLFRNVTVTQNTRDMKAVYARARCLLVPSLWWESGPRVIVEALINGIPVIASDSGGIPEVLGSGGEIFSIPEEYRQEPYTKLFPQDFVNSLASRICKYWDDELFYRQASVLASRAYNEAHDLKVNGDALYSLVQGCIKQYNKTKP